MTALAGREWYSGHWNGNVQEDPDETGDSKPLNLVSLHSQEGRLTIESASPAPEKAAFPPLSEWTDSEFA